MGSKVRRVYDAPQTSLERVTASASAHSDQIVALKKLRRRWIRFSWGKRSERKIAGIYAMANQRHSPQAIQKNGKLSGPKAKMSPRPGCGKDARQRAWKSLRDSHFPTATTTSSRLHSEMSRRVLPK